MPRLELTPEETATLHEVLESYLSELRMEIADADSMDFREQLKAKGRFLKNLLPRLEA
jgi:hypothetical protein